MRGLLENREYNIDDNNFQDTQRRGLLPIIERLQSKVDSLQTRNSELEQRLLLQMEAASNGSPAGTSSSNVLLARERAAQCDIRAGDSSVGQMNMH